MSKEANQATALLALCGSSLQQIGREGHYDSAINTKVESAIYRNQMMVRDYPGIDNERKFKRWLKRCNAGWAQQGDGMAEWSPCVLATMASNICEDLLDKDHPPAVRAQIEALRDATVQISYHYAEKTEQEYAHFQEADLMLSQYYDIINFER